MDDHTTLVLQRCNLCGDIPDQVPDCGHCSGLHQFTIPNIGVCPICGNYWNGTDDLVLRINTVRQTDNKPPLTPEEEANLRECPRCHASIPRYQRRGSELHFHLYEECQTCQGTGRWNIEGFQYECPACRGERRVHPDANRQMLRLLSEQYWSTGPQYMTEDEPTQLRTPGGHLGDLVQNFPGESFINESRGYLRYYALPCTPPADISHPERFKGRYALYTQQAAGNERGPIGRFMEYDGWWPHDIAKTLAMHVTSQGYCDAWRLWTNG